jgi:hypothetical protein
MTKRCPFCPFEYSGYNYKVHLEECPSYPSETGPKDDEEVLNYIRKVRTQYLCPGCDVWFQGHRQVHDHANHAKNNLNDRNQRSAGEALVPSGSQLIPTPSYLSGDSPGMAGGSANSATGSSSNNVRFGSSSNGVNIGSSSTGSSIGSPFNGVGFDFEPMDLSLEVLLAIDIAAHEASDNPSDFGLGGHPVGLVSSGVSEHSHDNTDAADEMASTFDSSAYVDFDAMRD